MKISWNYIAGFVDGEGSLVKMGETNYRVLIPQTHEGVLKEIQRFSGIGNILKAKRRKVHWKESWVYYIAKQKDVLFFVKKIAPFLIVKKGAAENLLPKVSLIVRARQDRDARLQKTIRKCKFLKGRGLSYRQIGKRLGIDHGYARRLVLYK